jgi:diguanylate cyclase (GGDEF)-like protein/PAS domain S-box-containing protein
MHRTLARQLRKLDIEASKAPDDALWVELLKYIDATYTAADDDRYILERSLTISSDEMQALYQKQKVSYENRQHSILNALPDVLFFLSEDGLCLEVMSGNKRLRDNYQRIGVGKHVHEVFPDHAYIFYDAIKKALDKGDLVVIDYDLVIDDQTRYFEGRIMPAQYQHDGKRTVVFIAIDVTRRLSSQVQARLLNTVFESSKDGMMIVDRHFKLVSANSAFCALNNVSREDIGKALPGIKDRILKQENGKDIAKALYRDGYWVGEITGQKEDGDVYPLWLTINTVKDDRDMIINYVMMLSDVSEIKRSREELEHVATHDALTNLPNRILFQDRLHQAIKRCQRNDTVGGLFFMDLDRFKTVNDNLGHQIGDNLLIQVTRRLQKICRKTDTLARLGGDEFTLIVEDVGKVEELSMIAEKILNMFLEPFELGNYKLDVSASIGVSVFPQDSLDPGELIRHADTAMYSAKENGRNNFRFYTEELTSNAYEYFEIEIAMRSALQFDQFFLVYQPQFDLITNEIIGVEALIRWLHPKLGVISPARFIPVAETTGQIEQIGEWVIMEAARQARTWDRAGLPPFTVSLNISRKQLIVPGLSWSVSQIIDDTGIDGSRFEFEITESSILDRQEIVYANLKELKSMGISLAIDDFGTGYSSLVNLKQFPLSRLKIDQSFVRDVTKDTNDEAIIRATIALGKSLQLAIIAEGVETEEQREFLVREGCEHAQGYLYSEPLLPEQIIELFQKVNRTIK